MVNLTVITCACCHHLEMLHVYNILGHKTIGKVCVYNIVITAFFKLKLYGFTQKRQ